MAPGVTALHSLPIRIRHTLWKNMCMPKNQASWATMAHLQAQVQDAIIRHTRPTHRSRHHQSLSKLLDGGKARHQPFMVFLIP